VVKALLGWSAIGIALLMLIWIGLLPRIFFRPGRRNLPWWLNSMPFWIAGVTLLAVAVDVASPYRFGEGWLSAVLPVASLVLSGAAARLLRRALSSHANPPALWHQQDDVPMHLVTDLAYARIRHPLYASFLLTLVACALAAPHGATLLALALGACRLHATAAAEEEKFLHSDLASQYAAYLKRTGRFVPSLRAAPRARTDRLASPVVRD
jgi:protein-S-isoprenylcysteine O-methyltransferase Ste14